MFKYGGHAPKHLTHPDKFEMRKDKYMFHKLARQLKDMNVNQFLLSNFLINRKTWTGDLVKPEAMDVFRKWIRVRDSLNYTYETDLRTILNHCSLTDAIKPKADGSYPELFTLLLQKEITIESVVIIHAMTHCLNVWDEQYKDDYIYGETAIRIRKYLPFLNFNMNELKEITKRVLTET